MSDDEGSNFVIPAVTVGSKNGVDRRVDRKMDRSKSRTDLLAAGKKRVYDVFNEFQLLL